MLTLRLVFDSRKNLLLQKIFQFRGLQNGNVLERGFFEVIFQKETPQKISKSIAPNNSFRE